MVLIVFLFHNDEENHWCRNSWVASKPFFAPRLPRNVETEDYATISGFENLVTFETQDRAAKQPGISVMLRPARTIRLKCGPVT